MGAINNKDKQLGMDFGTACHRLKKLILFKYIQKAEEDICFKCAKKIDIVQELSIEHKVTWQGKSSDLFWDLDNIAFSHLKCNKKTPVYPNGRAHGERKKYDAEGCRCDKCRMARMTYQREYRRRTRSSEEEHFPFKEVVGVS